jgi:hypothetical protein
LGEKNERPQNNICHVKLKELRLRFNYMCEKFGLHSNFHCDCEVVCDYDDYFIDDSGHMRKHATYLGLITLWEVVVCTKVPHAEWHARDCVFGKCDHCGVKNLAFCPIEEEGTSLM